MPRAKRYLLEGYTYHLTHRCHDARFLLRFAHERNVYREWLRRGVRRYRVPVYAFCITSNHVHLIVHAVSREAVGWLMDLVASATARQFNRRKGHSGAFWEDCYQCTAVEDGLHLWRCLRYVHLNMVRAGVVAHPAAWRWCSHDELTGSRMRYRVLNVERLLQSLDAQGLDRLRKEYQLGLDEALARRTFAREQAWTESVAVGSKAFVERVASFTGRRQLVYEPIDRVGDANSWCVREPSDPYVANSGPETAL